jgi:hypothetical protein
MGEKTITRDFHTIHKRNELKMHVSEMMSKMKEPHENVKVRKIGRSETTESRNWAGIANARLQAVKKMKNIGKLTNCLL